MDLRVYSKNAIEEFINLYRQCNCLWNVKSKDYLNKYKRNECYDKLLTVLKTIDHEADRKSVIKKINSVRASYRKEKRRIRESQKSGSHYVYKTKLWYFNLLNFLDDPSLKDNPDDSEVINLILLRIVLKSCGGYFYRQAYSKANTKKNIFSNFKRLFFKV